MKRTLLTTITAFLFLAAFAQQYYEIKEEFHSPAFCDSKFFMFNTDGTNQFVRSNNTGFEWGAFCPTDSMAWGPIGILYSDDPSHHRNALCFTSQSEYPGAYAYCQFDSEAAPGMCDSLVNLDNVRIELMIDGPNDLLGLMVRDAKGDWYYSKHEHGIYASGSEITFTGISDYMWMKIIDSTSVKLNTHLNMEYGLGDIRSGATEATPDLSYIIGGGMFLHEAEFSELSLRIGEITWSGTLPELSTELVSPENNSTLSILSTKLKWNYTGSGSPRFDVRLKENEGSFVLIGDSIIETELYLDALSDNSSYTWRVDVIFEDGSVEEGLNWIFSTKKGMSPYFSSLHSSKVTSSPFVKWTNLGPGMSGYCDEYFFHPTDPNFMYMNLDMGNTYYSADNGQSWITTKDWDTDGEIPRMVWTDFSRQDPDFGFGIDDKGYLLKTTDRGKRWIRGESFSKKHSVITVDPNNDNNWYIGAGQFWRVKDVHRSLNDLYGTQYRNTEYGHIWISKDKGLSWTQITDKFNENLDVAKIFVDPANSDLVYAFTNYGFYKSSDGGYHWELKGNGLPHNLPRDGDIYYNENTGDFNLYLLEQTHYEDDANGSVTWTGGVYISTDRGENWTNITGNLPVDLTKISQYDVHSKYYRALAYWFGIEQAAAESRFNKKPTSALSVFNRIVVDKDDPNMIFLSHNWKHDYSFGPGDIWRTRDGGANWVVVGRNGPYWRTEQDKTYWESRNNPLGINMKYAHLDHEMHYDGVAAGTRYMGGKCDGDLIIVHEQQVLRSSDKGDSWQQIDDDETEPGSGYWVGRGGSNLPGEGLVMETGMKRYLFLSGEHGLWISAPDGQKVKPDGVAVEQLTGQSKEQYDATSICAAAVHPKDTNTMYILMFRQSHRGYVRRTQDGGTTWENIGYPVQYGGNLSSDHIFQYDLLISKEEPDTMYFCVPTTMWYAHSGNCWTSNGPEDYKDYGVLRSLNGGADWELANSGLPAGGSVYSLDMDPEDSKTIYAALNKTMSGQDGALYRSSDGGDSWSEMSIPAGIESVNHLHVDRTNGALYLSAGEKVGALDKGGVWVSRDKGLSWEKIFYMPNVNEAYSSNADPNVIVVNVGRSNAAPLNTGAFYSADGGQTWTKASYEIGQAGRMRALRPDPFDADVMWCGLMGSGWYKGIVSGSQVRAMATNKYLFEHEVSSLDASASIGTGLTYQWALPEGISLSSTTTAAPSFTAPEVQADTTFKLLLFVSDGRDKDSLQVLVTVRNINVSARELVEWVGIDIKSVNIEVDEEFQMTGSIQPAGLEGVSVFWKSLDPGIASCTSYGLLRGRMPGSCKVVALAGNYSDTVNVSVSDAEITVTSLNIVEEDLIIEKSESFSLTVVIEPEDATNKEILWSSSNEIILTIDNTGLIEAIDTGKVLVYAINEQSGLRDSCSISITPKVSLNTFQGREIKVYPNPTRDMLYFNGPGGKTVLSLMTITGQTILQSTKRHLNLGMISDGTYILKVETDEGSWKTKIIKL